MFGHYLTNKNPGCQITYPRCPGQAVVELQLGALPSQNPFASLVIIPLIYLVLQCFDNHGFFNFKEPGEGFLYKDPDAGQLCYSLSLSLLLVSSQGTATQSCSRL